MRKLKTTIKVYDKTNENLGLERRLIDVPFTLDLDMVQAYRPEIKDQETYTGLVEFEGCIAYMSNGDSFWINKGYDELDLEIHDTNG